MKNKNILQKADNSETISISGRIPATLHNRLRNIQDAARQNGMKFPLSSVVISALKNSVDIAEIEMISIKSAEHNLRPNSLSSQEKSVM